MFFKNKENEEKNIKNKKLKKEKQKSFISIFNKIDSSLETNSEDDLNQETITIQNKTESELNENDMSNENIPPKNDKPNVLTEEKTSMNETILEAFNKKIDEVVSALKPKQETIDVEAKVQEATSELNSVLASKESEIAELKATIETLTTELTENKAKVEAHENEIKVQAEALKNAEYLELAKTEYAHLAGTSEEIAEKIKDIKESELNEATKELALTALKNVSVKNEGATQELGNAPEGDSLSPEEQLIAKSEAYAKEHGLNANVVLKDMQDGKIK